MAYSKTMLKGRFGYNAANWPLIVMERAKSDKPNTPVLCEVYGLEHECGSVYYREITLSDDLNEWEGAIRQMGFDPKKRYYKGGLI